LISSIFLLIISLIFENSLNEYGIFDSTRELEEWFYCFIACLIGTVYYITLFYMMDSGLSSSLIMYQNYNFYFIKRKNLYYFFFIEIIQSI
jgi:hypothetical protein